MPAPPPDVRRPPAAPPPWGRQDPPGRRPTGRRLRFVRGKDKGGTVDLVLANDLPLGRGSAAGAQLVDEMASRRHARIVWQGARPALEDLASTRGTYLNGKRVERPTPLTPGDRILICTHVLLVVDAGAPGEGPVPGGPAATAPDPPNGVPAEWLDVMRQALDLLEK